MEIRNPLVISHLSPRWMLQTPVSSAATLTRFAFHPRDGSFMYSVTVIHHFDPSDRHRQREYESVNGLEGTWLHCSGIGHYAEQHVGS